MTKTDIKMICFGLYKVIRFLIKIAAILFLIGLWINKKDKFLFRDTSERDESLIEHFTGFQTDD